MSNKQGIFNKSNFITDSFDILPQVKQFLKQPIEERNLDNVDEIRRYLSDIKPFSRLTQSLQNKILQRAQYESYARDCTIIRQGEESPCFYMILSGSALVTYQRIIDGPVETIDLFKRGCTFGEKGLITNGLQIFTVTSKTKLELLVLCKDDFKEIYMTQDRYCTNDDLQFLKTQVSFLRGFSIDHLNEFPHAIQRCNFVKSEVITRDSRRLKYVYVVRTGSISIWKRLDPDGPLSKEEEQFNNATTNDTNNEENDGENETLFSEAKIAGGNTDESTSQQKAMFADFRMNRLRREKTIDRQTSSALLKRAETIENIEKKFPGISDKRDRLELIDYDNLTINVPYPNSRISTTATNAVLQRSRSTISTKSRIVLPENSVYVHVKKLNVGQYFGLNDMLFPNQPALTVISNGCECLLLRKSPFVRVATDQYKQNIRRTEIPFPSDVDFYMTYHTHRIWTRYSNDVYDDAHKRSQQKHPQPVISRLA